MEAVGGVVAIATAVLGFLTWKASTARNAAEMKQNTVEARLNAAEHRLGQLRES
ncbi:MAG: hypothetical protein ACREKB_04110 [Candidatus Rokuibacteriota bacterium]